MFFNSTIQGEISVTSFILQVIVKIKMPYNALEGKEEKASLLGGII